MITIVRVDSMLLIGKLEADKMTDPRAIVMMEDKRLGLMPMIGDLKEIYITGPGYRGEARDQGLIDAYREAVSGIKIARPQNVIDIGGKK